MKIIANPLNISIRRSFSRNSAWKKTKTNYQTNDQQMYLASYFTYSFSQRLYPIIKSIEIGNKASCTIAVFYSLQKESTLLLKLGNTKTELTYKSLY